MNFDRIFAYTKALSENNDRTWFHDNHRDYELAKADFTLLVDMLKYEVIKLDTEFSESLLFTEPKDLMYRIPRDMRYSKSKEPYNPSFRAYLSPFKKDFLPFSYYVRIAHDGCFMGTGVWTWLPEQVNTLRSYVARNYEELDMLVAEGGLHLTGDKLKRMPRGYDEDHPAGEWLKHKSFFVSYTFKPEELESFESCAEAAAREMRRFEPLRRYFTEAYNLSAADEDEFDIY